jgi:hypothetical protein
MPKPVDLVPLADLFGVTVDWLLRGDTAPPGHASRDPHGVLLLSRADAGESGVREVVPFRLDREGGLWGQRIDAFMVVDAKVAEEANGLMVGDALLLERAPPTGSAGDAGAPLLVVDGAGQRPRLMRAAGARKSKHVDDGDVAVPPGAAVFRAVAVLRAMRPGGGQSGPGAAASWSLVESVQRTAAALGLPVAVVQAALEAARDAMTRVTDAAEPSGAGEAAGPAEMLAGAAGEMVAVVEGESRDPRLIRAVRAMARRLGPVLREGEETPTDLVTMAEAARLVGVTRQAVHLAVESGRLPGYGEGINRRVSLRETRMLVGRGSEATPAPVVEPQGELPTAVEPASGSPSERPATLPSEPAASQQSAPTAGLAAASPEGATGRRVLLADIIANPPTNLEPEMRAKLPGWARWADAEYDEETYLRYEQDPPPDLPPPWDYAHYDYWEERRSAAHGPQWWEYPEEYKRYEYAHFIRRMERMYREGDRELRGKLWHTSRTMYGPQAPLSDDDD